MLINGIILVLLVAVFVLLATSLYCLVVDDDTRLRVATLLKWRVYISVLLIGILISIYVAQHFFL